MEINKSLVGERLLLLLDLAPDKREQFSPAVAGQINLLAI